MIKNKIGFLVGTLVLIFSVFICSQNAQAGGSWQFVGDRGFSTGSVEQTYIATDSDLNQYVAYRDNSKLGKLTVAKLDMSDPFPKWRTLGKAGFSAGSVGGPMNDYYFSLKINSKNVPYVAFRDTTKKESITVMKYDMSLKTPKWVTVGKAGFSSGTNYLSFGIDSKDRLYVAIQDRSQFNNVTVWMYDTTTISPKWVIVGGPGFSGRGGSAYPSIAFDSNDVPYIGYLDVDGRSTVKKYDISTSKWLDVGVPSFSQYGVFEINIALDFTDTPYIYFTDSNNKPNVMKFDGIAWNYVGSPSFSLGYTMSPSFVIDSQNNLYVGYTDGGSRFQATVMKYDPSSKSWTALGLPGFTPGPDTVGRTSVAVDDIGEVYVSFQDNSVNRKLSVMKYENDGKSCEKDIKSFSIRGKYGEIDQTTHTINIRVPYGSNLTSLIPNILLSDYATVSPKSNVVNNFIKNSYYTVKAQNKNCVQSYKVNVTVNQWEEVGGVGFSKVDSKEISMDMDSYGVPYVSFNENIDSKYNAMSVMKYNSSDNTWSDVGARGFTPGQALSSNIAIDKYGVPYVSYSDGTKNTKLSVMFYDKATSSWYNIGAPGFSTNGVQWTKIAFDVAGKPYVVFSEDNSQGLNPKLSVMKWNGTSWVYVGNSRFGGVGSGQDDKVAYTSIVFDNNGIPYVVYVDSVDEKPTVKKFNGKTWIDVGNTSFTPGVAETTSIAIGTGNIPYVAFKDVANGNKASVMKLDTKTNKWVFVNKEGFSPTEAYNIYLKIYNGIPYVAFNSDYNAGARVTVMKVNGTNWIPVYNTDFSDGAASVQSLVMNKKGTPYVAYQDMVNKYAATVMRHP
ncbi:hypothetical protein IT400_01540 [Candidatus Nomurabacteria bacterium]|nr:hypothetical protein [Candidatus Nomurabacteria bacterium]